MTESVELMVQVPPAAKAVLATVLGVSPKHLMDYAIEVSTTLKSVLTDRQMTRKFGAVEHVQTEGWQLAGSLMGLVTSEGPCTELADGSYEAVIMLNTLGGKTIATASARCGVDEPTWKNKPKYARRSMAYTRAIGRVYAQNFRWLIKLAGYEGTPAEEMPDFIPAVAEAPKTAPVVLYSKTDPASKRWLHAELLSRALPVVQMLAVSDQLDGKPTTDLDKIVFEVIASSLNSPPT